MASEKTSPMAVNVLNYDADPTGAKDSTAAIQKAINDVAARGGGSVEIPGGIYRVTYPFIELKHRVEVFGHGQATRIIATGEKTVEFTTGVFHTGTYSVPMTNPNKGENKPMRMGVRDLFIRTNPSNLSLSDPNGSFWKELHTTPLMPKVVGVLFHTEMPDSSNEPDAVPLLSNVEIWGTDIGVAILGKDDQGMKVHNLRIRKALRQGLLVGKPVGHPLRKSKDQNADGADNKFSMSLGQISPVVYTLALRCTLPKRNLNSPAAGITTAPSLKAPYTLLRMLMPVPGGSTVVNETCTLVAPPRKMGATAGFCVSVKASSSAV